MRGADLVVETLRRAGVRTVFTLSGNQIMPLFDAAIGSGIELVHVRHEAAAVSMADGFAQVTGQVGVALVTAGPGFANALSPLFSARASESPVVLLSGDSPIAADGTGAFQELDQVGVAAPLTKLATRARRAEALGHEVARALRVAASGRPGPVHLALPFDLLNAAVPAAVVPEPQAMGRDPSPLDPRLLRSIAAAVATAERPLVLTGPASSPSRTGPLLGDLAAVLDCPVIAMESPRGLRDPALGAFAEVLREAKLVLALGKAIDHTLGFGRPAATGEASFVVIDPEDTGLERARRLLGQRLVLAGRGDADLAARALIETEPATGDRATWRAEVAEAIAHRGVPKSAATITPQAVGQAVQSLLDQAAYPILVADGGEFGQWAQATVTAPTRLINGPGGAIGGGLGQAIAVKLARPDATVVALMGDGTIGFHLAEFDTAVRHGANLIAVVGNDACWNAEHQIQLRDYGPERLIGCDLAPTRYDLAVAGLGGHGEHVTDPAELAPALARAVASGRPACVNVMIEGSAAPTFTRPAAG